MNKIPDKTLKLLKHINKQKHFNIQHSILEDISMLDSLGYIAIYRKIPKSNSNLIYPWENYLYITNEGKMYLSTLKFEYYKIHIPIAISSCLSIIAIIISIIALLKP